MRNSTLTLPVSLLHQIPFIFVSIFLFTKDLTCLNCVAIVQYPFNLFIFIFILVFYLFILYYLYFDFI